MNSLRKTLPLFPVTVTFKHVLGTDTTVHSTVNVYDMGAQIPGDRSPRRLNLILYISTEYFGVLSM